MKKVINDLLNRIDSMNVYKSTFFELNKLSDRDLIDIGISRDDIHEVAKGSFERSLDNSKYVDYVENFFAKVYRLTNAIMLRSSVR